MTLSATDILELLNKANQLGISPNIEKCEDGYYLKLYYDWQGDNDFYIKTVFVSNEGISNWKRGNEHFESMKELLDEHIERYEKQRIKAQEREKLIKSLTPEQRELLGL